MMNSYPFTPAAANTLSKTFVSDQTKGELGAFGNPNAKVLTSSEAGGEEWSPSQISLGNNAGANQNVLAHEMLHALHDTAGASFNPDQFNAQWEAAKNAANPQVKQIFNKIDSTLSSNKLYSGIDKNTLANERFAFLGENLGQNGLSAFPAPIQSFYSKIFTNDDYSNR